MNTFERDGVRFRFPANWELEAEDSEDGGWTVTAHSPDFAFLLVTLRPEADDPAQLADQTLRAMVAEYQDLDAENVVESLGGLPAIGHDIDVVTMDTTMTCRTRCVSSPAGPLLVMTQVTDYDRARAEPALAASVASIEFEAE